jgi:hypothetical protein
MSTALAAAAAAAGAGTSDRKRFRIQATSKLDGTVEVNKKKERPCFPERTTDKKRVK